MKCPNCGYEPTLAEMQHSPDDCVKCGINYQGYARSLERRAEEDRDRRAKLAAMAPVVKEAAQAYAGAQPVVVVDIKMGFWSMVIFMVKWAIAAIPALLILSLLAGLVASLVIAVPSFFEYRDRAQASSAQARSAQPSYESIPVLSDPAGRHFLVDIERAGSNVVITTRRDGSAATTYSRRFVDCRAGTSKSLGESGTLDGLEGADSEQQIAPVAYGSAAYYIARHACQGIPIAHQSLQ